MSIGRSLPMDEYLYIGCSLGLKAQDVELIYKECIGNLRNLMPKILFLWRESSTTVGPYAKVEELISVLRDLGLEANANKVEDMYKQNKPLCYKDF